MSDYLSHLAFRSLHPGEVLQPRLASRFEPTTPAGPLPFEAMFAADQAETTSTATPGFSLAQLRPAPATPPSPLKSGPDDYRGDVPDTAVDSTPPARRLSAGLERAATGLTPPAAPRSDQEQEHPKKRPAAQVVLPPDIDREKITAPQPTAAGMPMRLEVVQPAQPEQLASPLPEANEDHSQTDFAALLVRLQQLERAAERPETGAQPRDWPFAPPQPAPPLPVEPPLPLPTPTVKTVEATASPPPHTPPLHPLPSPLPLVKPAEPAATPTPHTPQIRPLPPPPITALAAPAQPTPPTVQVTIGRIEVRATSPQPRPKQPQAKAPAMSLEEYLHQRNGGAR